MNQQRTSAFRDLFALSDPSKRDEAILCFPDRRPTGLKVEKHNFNSTLLAHLVQQKFLTIWRPHHRLAISSSIEESAMYFSHHLNSRSVGLHKHASLTRRIVIRNPLASR